MSLLWHAMSLILVCEVFVLTLLCAPFRWGVRKTISRWMFRVKAFDRLDAAFRYLLFGLVLALVESISTLRIARLKTQAVTNTDTQAPASDTTIWTDRRLQEARAERNFYLASFSVAAIIAIMRLVKLALIEVQLRTKIKHYNGNRPITETGETIADSALTSADSKND